MNNATFIPRQLSSSQPPALPRKHNLSAETKAGTLWSREELAARLTPPVNNFCAPYPRNPKAAERLSEFLYYGRISSAYKETYIDWCLQNKEFNALTWLAIKGQITEIISIDPDKVQNFGKWLESSPPITGLRLEFSNIGDAGAILLASALKVNRTITMLDLSYNGIGVEGATALASALKVNHTVTVLRLKGNTIGAAGAEAIASALKENLSLAVLDLCCNKLGDAGAESIASALKANQTLTELDLGDNGIRDSAAASLKLIQACLESNKAIPFQQAASACIDLFTDFPDITPAIVSQLTLISPDTVRQLAEHLMAREE
jgi:hypothetical protein